MHLEKTCPNAMEISEVCTRGADDQMETPYQMTYGVARSVVRSYIKPGRSHLGDLEYVETS